MQINKKKFTLNSSMNFGTGWNSKITDEIQNCNVEKISANFSRRNIDTNFKENKVVAWCCEKVTNIFEKLNNKYKINLALPKGIFVEDFSKIDTANNRMFSFCNWFQNPLLNSDPKIFDERTLFFNSNSSWENINYITEEQFKSGFWSNNHFLINFFHEFTHSSHNEYLLHKFKPEKLRTKLEIITSKKYVEEYQKKYKELISHISGQALANPLETIAEYIPNKIIKAIDPLTQDVILNPFDKELFFFKKIKLSFKPKTEKTALIGKIWNLNL